MRPGDPAPDFELPDQGGRLVRLSDLLRRGPVVLFFYPAAMTLGCTAEVCHFRDLGAAFTTAGAIRVGISPDPVGLQNEFATLNNVDFTLLSDPEGSVARLYDARRRFGPREFKRATYVIGPDGTMLDVITSEVRMRLHGDRALEVLRAGRPVAGLPA